MKKSSMIKNIVYNNDKPSISVLMETEFSKEIRIVFKAEQEMKEHKTAFPITVEMFEGDLDFGVDGEVFQLTRGDLVALKGNVPHNLSAKTNCIVRLTLTKSDDVNRVKNVVE
jgi:quercetin dioxygenase-like cupin family protein